MRPMSILRPDWRRRAADLRIASVKLRRAH